MLADVDVHPDCKVVAAFGGVPKNQTRQREEAVKQEGLKSSLLMCT